jgi:hypothetical protein
MLLDVLASPGLAPAAWLSMGRDSVPAARLTNPSKTGPKAAPHPDAAMRARASRHRFARPADRPLKQREGHHHG